MLRQIGRTFKGKVGYSTYLIRPTIFNSYLIAVALSVAIIVIKIIWRNEFDSNSPYILFITPVVISSWLGGFGPGMLATVINGLATHIFLGHGRLIFNNLTSDFVVLLFILEGFLVSTISQRRRWAEDKLVTAILSEEKTLKQAIAAEKTAAFLAETSKILSSSLDYRTTLNTISRVMVPKLADWCIIDVLDGDKYERLAFVDKNPELQLIANEIKDKYPPDTRSPGGTGKVLRTGKPIYLKKVNDKDAFLAARKNHQLLNLIKKLGMESYIIVPIIIRRKTYGQITIVSADPNRPYQQTDFKLMQELSTYIAMAIDNSLLFRRAKEELKKRKQTESDLRNSRNQLEVILKNVADGITVQDAEGRIIFANQAAAKESGFDSVEQMLDFSISESDQKYELYNESGKKIAVSQLPGRRALRGEKNPEAILKYVNKLTDEQKWSVVKARPVFDQDGRVLYAINIFHDISASKQLEQQRDTLVSVASHELKNPVTTVKAYTQLLSKKVHTQDIKTTLNQLSTMDEELNKLLEIIQDLLDISKIRTSKLEFNFEEVDINLLVQETITKIGKSVTTHEILLEKKINEKVIADKQRIQQVLENLINNAVKYSPGAKNIVVMLSADQKQAQVSVKDYGIGISKEDQKKIFESFYRTQKAIDQGLPGSGLGLYIAAEIIKQHKGKLWVESEIDKGSVFHFSLPCVKNLKDVI